MQKKHSKDSLSQDKDKEHVAATCSANQGQAMQDVGPDGKADDQVEVVGVSCHLLVLVPAPRVEAEAAAAPGTDREAMTLLDVQARHDERQEVRGVREETKVLHTRMARVGKHMDALDRRARAQEERDRVIDERLAWLEKAREVNAPATRQQAKQVLGQTK